MKEEQPATPTITDRVQALGAWLRERRPSWRAFVIAALLVALADLGARALARWDLSRDNFALPWRSDALAREYLDRLAEYDGPLIAMVGDSTLQPLPEMPKEITVPSMLQRRLRQVTDNPRWKVANLGLSGAHLGDLANVIHLLPKNVEVAIITLNYKFLGHAAETPINIYPDLSDEHPPPKMKPVWRVLSTPVLAAEDLWRLIKSHWFLLRNGIWITDRVFSNRPGNWLHWQVVEGSLRQILHALHGYMKGVPVTPQALYHPWKPEYIAKMRGAVGNAEIKLNSPPMIRFGASLLELRRRGFITIVYATPYDWTHLEQFQIVDRAKVHDGLDWLGSFIEQTGAVFLDLVDVGEPDWFLDMDHLSVKGREKLANLLIQEIRKRQSIAESIGG